MRNLAVSVAIVQLVVMAAQLVFEILAYLVR